MKEHDKDKNIHNTQIFSIDWIKKTCWKENGWVVTTLIEAVGQATIPYQACF
jgi:hypothetical protein